MRLKTWEVEAIKACLAESFGPAAKVFLFGSRTDDAKRGGDIDLYVVAEPLPENWRDMRSAFWICLQERLGEQKIDIVVARNPDDPIERIAQRDGIEL
ncbi:nucleotidyltransferase domain-containing protein [Hydrogenimonas sp. SS33]|uniref:nucleotidyltransferase domain-containing protein n=1 Tax=Hydrogenimonas leucolamina TaxID=2954236 RepID=UPI00336BE945